MGIDNERVLLVKSDAFGVGEDELGVTLFDKFFGITVEAETLPGTIVFLNTGVKVLENEDITSALKVLEEKGVSVIYCGTCINYFELNDDVKVGTVGNMRQIQDLMFTKNVITM